MLDRYSFLSGRQLEEGFIHFVDAGGVQTLPQGCHAVITIDEIQDCDDYQLNGIRDVVRTLAASDIHFLLILAYTSRGVKTKSTMMLPVLSEIKSILSQASISFDDIEVKPMTLADIATTMAFTMSPNNFPSNFVNRLFQLTCGVQLFVRETLAYLKESGSLTFEDGKWLLSDDTSILDSGISIEELESKRIDLLASDIDSDLNNETIAPRLLQLCRNLVKHNIMDEQSASKLVQTAAFVVEHSDDAQMVQSVREILPNGGSEIVGSEQRDLTLVINAENIARAEEILTPLAQKYKMPQVLQNAQYMLDTLPENEYRSVMTALKFKCDAQIFIGMFQDAHDTALQLCSMAKKYGDSHDLHVSLYWEGYASGLLQDFDTSDNCLSRAVELALQLGDDDAAMRYLCIHSMLQNDKPNSKEALSKATVAHSLAEKLGDKKYECHALLAMAYAHKALFDMDRSKIEVQLALKLLDDIDDLRLEARAHAALAVYYQNNHETDKSLQQYHTAEHLMLQINDTPALAGIYVNIGNLLCDTSCYDDAIKHFEDALSASKNLNILTKMLGAYIGLGSANMYKGNSMQAEHYFDEAMTVAKQIGSNWALAYANASMGEYHQQKGECEEALEYYQICLDIDRRNNDDINVYCDMINIAAMCSYTGRIDEGIQYLQEAEKMPVGNVKESMAGSVNNTFAGLYYAKGDYELALSYYQKALEEDLKSNHNINASISYGNISGVYYALGDYDKAVQMADKAISIDRQLNDNLQLANHLDRQAANYQAQNRLEDCRDTFLEAARLFRSINVLDDEAIALRSAAAVMHDLDDYAGANRTLHEALSALEETGNFEMQPGIIKMLALLASEEGYADDAILLYKKAADIYGAHDMQIDDVYGDIMQSLAEVYSQNGNNTEAIGCYVHLAEAFEAENPDYSVENRILAGKMYMQTQDEQGAAKEFDHAFGLLEKMADNDLRAAAKSDIGDYLCWRKMSDEGISFKIKAINDIKDSTQNRQLLGRLYYTLAERFLEQKKYGDTLENYFAALRIYQEDNDYWQQGFISNNIGYTYDSIGQIKTAAQFYHRAYNCYKEVNELDGMYNNLNNEALMLEKTGRMEEAAASYRAALDMLEKEQADPAEIGAASFNVAKCLMATESDDAVKYFNKAYANYKEDDMIDDMLACLDLLAQHYVNKKNASSAESCISIAKSLLGSKRAYEMQAKIYNLIGCIYTYIMQPSNAVETFYKSIRILAEHDQWDAMAHCHFLMATKLMQDADKLNDIIEVKGKPRKINEFCLECLDFAVKTAEKEGDKPLQSDSLSTRSLLRWNNGEYDLFEADIQTAISIAPSDEALMSLMLHYAVLLLMQKEYDRSEQKFLETYEKAVSKSLFEEQLTTKAWLCYLYFEKGDYRNAMTILNEITPNIEFAVAKVPGLTVHLAKR